MINNLGKNKLLWIIVSVLSLLTAGIGVLYQDVYRLVISDEMLPGTISQDTITILVSLVLLISSIRTRKENIKSHIIILSSLAYLFYAYGIYAIEQVYNMLYILYIAVFSLSFWSIIYGFINIKRGSIQDIKLSKPVKYITISFSLFTPLLFYFLWTSQLVPLMSTGEKIEFTYSIYILDMAFILPALIISAVLLIKNNMFGLITAPILFFKSFTLLFSVGLGALFKALYDQPVNTQDAAFYIILSLLFLILAILNFSAFKPNNRRNKSLAS
jgi:hypothetical protein